MAGWLDGWVAGWLDGCGHYTPRLVVRLRTLRTTGVPGSLISRDTWWVVKFFQVRTVFRLLGRNTSQNSTISFHLDVLWLKTYHGIIFASIGAILKKFKIVDQIFCLKFDDFWPAKFSCHRDIIPVRFHIIWHTTWTQFGWKLCIINKVRVFRPPSWDQVFLQFFK